VNLRHVNVREAVRVELEPQATVLLILQCRLLGEMAGREVSPTIMFTEGYMGQRLRG